MNPTRDAIRRDMRRARRALSPQVRRHAARELARRLSAHPLVRNSRDIACFLPNDGEVDLRPAVERLRDVGKRCYLPVLSPLFHNRLWFAPFAADTPLVPNRFGIPEPRDRRRAVRGPRELDLILMPLVAFDGRGNRLGMGGGFYDRTLAYLGRHRAWRRPHLMGVAFGFQEVEAVPSAPWDIPLQGVMTDAGWRAAPDRR